MRIVDRILMFLWDATGERQRSQAERRAHTDETIRSNVTVRRSAARQIVRTQRFVRGRGQWS